MTNIFATALFTFVSLWLFTGMLACLCYPLLQRLLLNIHPAQRSSLLLFYLLLPLLIATAMTALLYWPPVALISQHCHGATCAQHGPENQFALLPAVFLGLLILLRFTQIYWRQLKPAQRLRNELRYISREQQGFREIQADKAAAFTLGWKDPEIYISSGLLSQINNRALQCIIAHETAHRTRHDNLRQLVLRLACAPLPKRWLTSIRQAHSLACEQACDLVAAKAHGAENVAEALLTVSRLQSSSPTTASAFADNFTSLRIKALLQDTPPRLSQLPLLAIGMTATSPLLLLLNPLHVLLEHSGF